MFDRRDQRLVAIEYTGESETIAKFDTAEATRQWRAIMDALHTLQVEFGPDHYQLPESDLPEGCPVQR